VLEKCDLTINYIHQKDVDKKFFAVNAFSEIELTLSFKYLTLMQNFLDSIS
jgi:hypothetical protein